MGQRCSAKGEQVIHQAPTSVLVRCVRRQIRAPRYERRATPRIETRGIRSGGEVRQVGNRDGGILRSLGRTRWNFNSRRRPGAFTSKVCEDYSRPFVETVDPIERDPRTIEGLWIRRGMLQRKRGESLSVPTPPRFAPRVIEGEERVEARGAGIVGTRVACAALGTAMARVHTAL